MPTATLNVENPTAPIAATIDVNMPAYPVPAGARTTGITMYDWLAAMAIQGILTKGMKVTADRALTDDEKDDEMAERAYKVAGAMLRARTAALKELNEPK